jgi:phage/plasmid-associated DNA primase
MKKDTLQNSGRVEAIGDEAVYLRINQLQKGLLQFTDSTNAERVVREYGADIRYIAPWKKWVVWDDTHWQIDTGALLYTKQLEMVRNIYAELYKTADYRDRMDIEKYAIQSESMRRREASVRAAQLSPASTPRLTTWTQTPGCSTWRTARLTSKPGNSCPTGRRT